MQFISETDLNVLAQEFYERAGPEARRTAMTAKPDIVAGLRGVFEALGYQIVPGGRLKTVDMW